MGIFQEDIIHVIMEMIFIRKSQLGVVFLLRSFIYL